MAMDQLLITVCDCHKTRSTTIVPLAWLVGRDNTNLFNQTYPYLFKITVFCFNLFYYVAKLNLTPVFSVT